MNKVTNAIKLYVKTAINPITLGFGILTMAIMVILFMVDPDPVGSEKYMSMIGAIGMGHMGVFFMVFLGASITHRIKFFGSSCNAKHLFITAPIVFSFVICLTYDVIIAIIAYANLGISAFADVMIYNSIYSGVMILSASLLGKRKFEWLYVFPYMALIAISGWIGKRETLQNGFGMTVSTSVIIAIAAYTISILVTVILANRWWKTGDRLAMPTKFMQSVMGGQ